MAAGSHTGQRMVRGITAAGAHTGRLREITAAGSHTGRRMVRETMTAAELHTGAADGEGDGG